MITKIANIGELAGMDTRSIAEAKSFYKLQNVHFRSDLSCVDTQWGWEPLRPWAFGRHYYLWESKDIISTFSWTTSSSRTEYIIQEGECAGVGGTSICLYYQYADGTKVVLDENRKALDYLDSGTQYIPYGRLLIMFNGSDKMLKFWGDKLITPFGFTTQPPSPGVSGVDPTRLVPNSSASNNTNNNWEIPNNGIGIALFPHIVEDNNDFEWVTDSTVAYVLPSNSSLSTIPSQGHPKDKTYWGLGITEPEARNTYSYKVAWVSDTGSESPASEPTTVSWITPNKHSPDAENQNNINPFAIKYGVEITHLPTGPDHVVARRIYRTKNKEDGITGAGDEYFLVAEIRDNLTERYVDFIPDSELVTREPGVSGSWIIPGAIKYATTWDGRLWIAGGNGAETTVYWSAQGRPEQFGGFDFFDCGVREGGSITALHAVDRGLYVFREHSIDLIVKGANGEYKIATVASSIGTTATNSIVTVPGIGTFFLSYDGVYVIRSADGSIQKLSFQIQSTFDRMNRAAMPRATAVYSRKWQEYWVHFPSDGDVIANTGAVFHLGINGWSIRGTTDQTNEEYWKFHRLATDFNGEILIAPSPAYISTGDNPGWRNVGIQIVSRSNTYGITLPNVYYVEEEGYVRWTDYITESIDSTIRSGWVRFDKSKNSTVSAVLGIYQTSIQPASFSWLWDGRQRILEDWDSTTALVSADEWNSADADPVWDTVAGLTYASIAEYDVSLITNHRLVTARFDMQTYARDSVAWSFSGADRIMLHSWDIRYTQNNRQALRSDAQ